ncbi:MAG TPA: hypothetical protein VL026_07745 [Rhizomicrobium sp.]|nr:hypothetical protein [Rhizomicrobium sp.]
MKLLPVTAAASLAAILFAVPSAEAAHSHAAAAESPAQTSTQAAPASAKLKATQTALRALWQGHVDAVRKVVVAEIAGNSAALKTAEGEVVANAHGIANAIAPYYGQPAADKLFPLLAGHYGAVKAYLDASVAKDAKAQGAATDKLTSNADQIATFLSTANPHLPKATLMELLQVHASHHIDQIQELIAKDTAAEVKTRAAMSAHMNVIADALANGIAAQFPAKF